jgi:hypothetical protein
MLANPAAVRCKIAAALGRATLDERRSRRPRVAVISRFAQESQRGDRPPSDAGRPNGASRGLSGTRSRAKPARIVVASTRDPGDARGLRGIAARGSALVDGGALLGRPPASRQLAPAHRHDTTGGPPLAATKARIAGALHRREGRRIARPGWHPTCARELRADDRTRHIPVITCSGQEERPQHDARVDAMLTKPCPPRVLLHEVRRLVPPAP